LTSFQGNSFTDYINAVFVDVGGFFLFFEIILTNFFQGYRSAREYIVTEWPLPDTISYLWSLVYDYDVSAVVVLSNPEHSTQFPQFWPETSRSKKYGPVFTIDHLSHNHYPNIKSWIFRINKKIVSLTELMVGELLNFW
jgi:protein tyrosine phosphatase